ncbi:cytochrome b [Paraburkholderia bonniea]|uniref:cytochrome b n=1 Tax=Paraburkholderia bonniea TaxID=2152891 RepID=UPI0012918E39|nr:cytochrome b [Paraburkholderia bonniea]WJF92134.1 cytochrome b [Paraburkholderia bonniea]WJF95454.1 cytochrome b [Paraburkholderia bonniea]
MSSSSSSVERYSRPAIFFHWAIALLVALAYLSIEIRGPKDSDSREFWSSIHFWAGVLVLALAVCRVLWRLWQSPPPERESNALLVFLARLAHLALYVFIFVQPLLGILLSNTAGYPVNLAWLNLNFTLVGADAIASPALQAAHVWLGNAFYWIIGLHALAAIGHHVIFKDRTLRRML